MSPCDVRDPMGRLDECTFQCSGDQVALVAGPDLEVKLPPGELRLAVQVASSKPRDSGVFDESRLIVEVGSLNRERSEKRIIESERKPPEHAAPAEEGLGDELVDRGQVTLGSRFPELERTGQPPGDESGPVPRDEGLKLFAAGLAELLPCQQFARCEELSCRPSVREGQCEDRTGWRFEAGSVRSHGRDGECRTTERVCGGHHMPFSSAGLLSPLPSFEGSMFPTARWLDRSSKSELPSSNLLLAGPPKADAPPMWFACFDESVLRLEGGG